ncbi:hypothetical protein [Virgibacillus salexigens]|uniref:hypothetical protein n=1 Tax=Virgibacillus salexigens TaxID=61016 RepID=UPI00308174BE
MEKTVVIDGKQIRFKSTAATPLRYKAQFGTDFFSDMMKMYPLTKMDIENSMEDEEVLGKVFQTIDFDMFYNILWSLAKTANKEIPEPMEWLDEFEEFPLMDIFPEVQELLMKNLQSKKK